MYNKLHDKHNLTMTETVDCMLFPHKKNLLTVNTNLRYFKSKKLTVIS